MKFERNNVIENIIKDECFSKFQKISKLWKQKKLTKKWWRNKLNMENL